jgi:hypothetical protein
MTSDAVSNAMSTRQSRTDVALILWNPDVIQLVSLVLRQRNLKSSGLEPWEGVDRIKDSIVCWSPRVVVFDLDPPYERSAAIALHLLEKFPDCSFVMTCADSSAAVNKAPWLAFHPIFQKPYEMDEMANMVRSMVRESVHLVMAAMTR